MTSTAEFIVIPAFPTTSETPSLDEAIQLAIRDARTACTLQGADSAACAVAWDIVEELQAERSHRAHHKNSFEIYCEENPDALECRIYDV